MQTSSNRYADSLIAIILLVVIQAMLAIKFDVISGVMGGPDVYMWLNRVLELYSHGDWSNHAFSRINPPAGYEQHWTRPYDFLLYAGAWTGSHVTDFNTSLQFWGAIISPILGIIAVFAVIWVCIPLIGSNENGIAGLLFVTQMSILASFVAGRADHQSLILLLFLLSLGIGMRMLIAPFSARTCYIAALLSGVAIWVSVESILYPLLLILTFGRGVLFC